MTLREQLVRDEGKRLKPYADTVGKTTIGVGRNLDDVGISEEEAMFLLDNDIKRTENDVLLRIPWASMLDEVRRAALVNLAFNMGINKLVTFARTLNFIQNHNYQAAHDELLHSKYAVQVGDRAKRVAKQILTGEWQ